MRRWSEAQSYECNDWAIHNSLRGRDLEAAAMPGSEQMLLTQQTRWDCRVDRETRPALSASAGFNKAGESPFPRVASIPWRNTEAGMDKLDAMRMFVRVVERGSFSAVAKERGIGQPAVSKQISALEDELGAELIRRTSRSIALTEPGRDFYESALHILDDFENATSRVGRGQTAPKGLIRVTVPPTFARLHMVSKLPAFFAAYPDMAVEMAASESPATIIEDGFDLAIHSGDLPDSTLVARRFAQTMIILVATPQYLARYGAPESPDDLNRFRAVVFIERGSVQPWSFGPREDLKRVIPTGVFRTSDIEQMRMGVLEHLGIAQAPAWLFAAELREGTVLRLLTPFERAVPILAVRPASRRLPAKVRIFIEHLEKTFALCSQFNPPR
jgi:DNA-binding transcriptional LysR family regulator